jgi:hypothetical protein
MQLQWPHLEGGQRRTSDGTAMYLGGWPCRSSQDPSARASIDARAVHYPSTTGQGRCGLCTYTVEVPFAVDVTAFGVVAGSQTADYQNSQCATLPRR